jgi:hypothetical protein
MAWTAPTNVATGDVLTATKYNNEVVGNALAGGPIYATEALRDAAIPTPFEGQRAYITASTVAAATGGTTAVPTGLQTIYNGAAWVSVTPVNASTDNQGTTTSTSYTATLSAGTNPSVTLSTGTTALIQFTAEILAPSANIILVGIAVSGATTRAAQDGEALRVTNSTFQVTYARMFVVTGLTAGTNTFTFNYRVSGGTGTIAYRAVTVQGIA